MDSSSSHGGCVLESDELQRLAGEEAVNVLKCGICWEFYCDPVILACGHTFCFKCLVQMARHARHNHSRIPTHNIFIGCPNCRRPIYISAILAHKLTHNYPLASFLESLKHRRVPKVKKATRATNTEPPEPCKPDKEGSDLNEESKKKKNQYDYDEERMNLLMANLDLVLRTLSATDSVLGDFSCAADIQQIVREFQNNSENKPREHNRGRRKNARFDPEMEELCSTLQDMHFGYGQQEHGTGSDHPHNTLQPETSARGQFPEPNSSSTSGIPETSFQDPAILSFAINPQAFSGLQPREEQFPPVGLYTFPGFGQN